MSYVQFENKVIGISRKVHRCEHCYFRIPKGSSYNKHKYMFDGIFYVCKSHLECHKKYMELNKDADYGDPWYGIDDFDCWNEWKAQQAIRYTTN